MSLGEVLLRPTAMLYRNLASMDVEESIRGNPLDGVVLLMGCDKTTPSLVMGAASVDLPTIGLSGGAMLNGKWRGQELGSGTGVWSRKHWLSSTGSKPGRSHPALTPCRLPASRSAPTARSARSRASRWMPRPGRKLLRPATRSASLCPTESRSPASALLN